MMLESTISDSRKISHSFQPILIQNWKTSILVSSIQPPCDEVKDTRFTIFPCYWGVSGVAAEYNRLLIDIYFEIVSKPPDYCSSFPMTFPKGISLFYRALEIMKDHPSYPVPAAVFAAMVLPYIFVEKVLCERSNDNLNIWTVVNRSTLEQRYEIYDRQWDLMEQFKGTLVDFNLIDRHDVPLEELISLNEQTWVIRS